MINHPQSSVRSPDLVESIARAESDRLQTILHPTSRQDGALLRKHCELQSRGNTVNDLDACSVLSGVRCLGTIRDKGVPAECG